MRAFQTIVPKTLDEALASAREARERGGHVAFAGSGSDLLGMMKERLVAPDVVIYLKPAKGLDAITSRSTGTTIGGQATLTTVSAHQDIRRHYAVLAEAAGSVATPQIRNVGTIAGNVCQRPWCWYYRNGFKCFKAGGNRCYSIDGENQFHAIFGGGPSYIVHPSDTAPALVALDATFQIAGPSGTRSVKAGDFFTLPRAGAARENSLADGEVLAAIALPPPVANARSTYHKILDREAWTHAVVSAAMVLAFDAKDPAMCTAARIVLGGVAPVPWRLPEVEQMLTGHRIDRALAATAGKASVSGARTLSKNAYKVPMTEAMVTRSLIALAERRG